jgi:probable HAF family extracellular repeat protein
MIKTVLRFLATISILVTSICSQTSVFGVTPAFYHFNGTLERGYWSNAAGVSADGTTVVGGILSEHWTGSLSAPKFDGLVWRVGSVPELIQGEAYAHVQAVSANGTDIVGLTQAFGGAQAYRRKAGGALQPLGTLDSTRLDSDANAISADGSVVVGRSATVGGWEAIRWTESTGMVGLGDLPGGDLYSEAYGVSADGAVIVGRGSTIGSSSQLVREAFRWTEAGGMQGLGDLPGGHHSSIATAVSGDGSIIVGSSAVANGSSGFRWTEATGMVELEPLRPGFGSSASAISMDGSIIGGGASADMESEAVVWNAQNKIMRVADLLKKVGLDGEQNGARLRNVTGISADGTTLVGTANRGSATIGGWGWVAVLPRSVYVPEPCGFGVLAYAASTLMFRRRGLRRVG